MQKSFPSFIFVDSSAFLALLDKDDENHKKAVSILKKLSKKRVSLFTTNFVRAEAHALILSVLGADSARRFLEELERSSVLILPADETDEKKAREIIFKYQDKDFSLVDTISFAVMERVGARTAFAFDKHFVQYGWEVLW